jgi:hypothetical protein
MHALTNAGRQRPIFLFHRIPLMFHVHIALLFNTHRGFFCIVSDVS